MLRAIRALREGRVFLFILVVISAGTAHGQTTAFTYQGQLSDAGALANASYDMRFVLFDTVTGGVQIGTNQSVSAVPVKDGVFTVQLDFGVNAFPGANRFVEISVKPASGGNFTTLAPRQQISSSPYAIRTLSAATADVLSSACVGCVQDTQIQGVAGSKVSGAIPVASLPTGSGNYIQNSTTQQAGSNFNISGNGVVGGNLTALGAVSIGGAVSTAKFAVEGGSGDSVCGSSDSGTGVYGSSDTGTGVFGYSFSGLAGEFVGPVNVSGNVGIGTSAPHRLLDVAGRARVGSIPLEGSAAAVCFNQAGDLLQCGASSLRLKTNVHPFLDGLGIVRRLTPISFNWKEGGAKDIGLGAEDVAKVAPSLTLINGKGEAEGVKYERLNIVLINAIKEQQAQIVRQQVQIEHLQQMQAADAHHKRCGQPGRPKAIANARSTRSRCSLRSAPESSVR